jgi:hypothetical protein
MDLIAGGAIRRLFAMHRPLDGGESGQGMVEYALILVLVSIVVIVVLFNHGEPDPERLLQRYGRSRLAGGPYQRAVWSSPDRALWSVAVPDGVRASTMPGVRAMA